MKSLQFTPAASADLDEILDYIAEDRPHTAVQVVKRIRERCEMLRYHPEMGQLYPKLGSGIRAIPQQRWVIFYRVESNSVQILRVLDGARHIDFLFD
ncbi:MAG: type II toxin-antitoxin system RelE/ParE family toxin [Pirellulaceae bacterium]|nr:type II toxin-antitoxin system RelE/ParE family toxin [Pirellulaceae bacterium]